MAVLKYMGAISTQDSLASFNYIYSIDHMTTFIATVSRDGGAPLKFMATLVQFEVYTDTKLLWQVEYDNSSSDHVFTGRLLTASGSPVSNKNVMIYLNETNVVNCTTLGDGLSSSGVTSMLENPR